MTKKNRPVPARRQRPRWWPADKPWNDTPPDVQPDPFARDPELWRQNVHDDGDTDRPDTDR